MRLLCELGGPWGVPSLRAYTKACSRVGVEGTGHHTFSPLVVSSRQWSGILSIKYLPFFQKEASGKPHFCIAAWKMISIYLVQSTLLSSWDRASSLQKELHPWGCGFWRSRPVVDREHLCLPSTLRVLDNPSSSVSQESLCADGGQRWLFHLNCHKLGKQGVPETDSSVEQNGRSQGRGLWSSNSGLQRGGAKSLALGVAPFKGVLVYWPLRSCSSMPLHDLLMVFLSSGYLDVSHRAS